MWKSLVSASGLVLVLTFSASAQISATRGPIQIEADRLDFLDREGKAIYFGNVDAVQGDARIRAEKLTIFFEKKAEGESKEPAAIGGSVGAVQRLLAEGTVYYMTPNEKAKGNKGVYDYKKNTIVLTGDVTLTRGENVIVGDQLVIDLDSGQSRVSAESKKKGERVRTVLITNDGGSN